jgi:hypothetical protein
MEYIEEHLEESALKNKRRCIKRYSKNRRRKPGQRALYRCPLMTLMIP